jgi:hypothetical protein
MNDLYFEDYEGEFGAFHFDGIFDGNGKKIIANKTIRSIFGVVHSNAIIKNLHIYADIDTSVNNYSGVRKSVGIIAEINEGRIENCKASGSIYVSESSLLAYTLVGGVVGQNEGIFLNVYCDADIVVVFGAVPMEYRAAIGGLIGSHGYFNNQSFFSIFAGSIKYKHYEELGNAYYPIVIGALLGDIRSYIENAYYYIDKLDNRTEDEKSEYFIPNVVIGFEYYTEFELISPTVAGVSDFNTIDFSEWDGDVWDFSGEAPQLRMFS